MQVVSVSFWTVFGIIKCDNGGAVRIEGRLGVKDPGDFVDPVAQRRCVCRGHLSQSPMYSGGEFSMAASGIVGCETTDDLLHASS